jgi:hypothetical protein
MEVAEGEAVPGAMPVRVTRIQGKGDLVATGETGAMRLPTVEIVHSGLLMEASEAVVVAQDRVVTAGTPPKRAVMEAPAAARFLLTSTARRRGPAGVAVLELPQGRQVIMANLTSSNCSENRRSKMAVRVNVKAIAGVRVIRDTTPTCRRRGL